MTIKIPTYQKIYNDIKFKINNQIYKDNNKIPTEYELCEAYNTSRITIRKSLSLLEEANYIKRIQGKGTFITSTPIIQDRSNSSKFFDDVIKTGKKPMSKVISLKITKPNEEIQKAMNISAQRDILTIEWIRYANSEAILFEKIIFLANYVKGLEKFNIENQKLYDILDKHFNISIKKGRDEFKPIFLKNNIAKSLNVKQNSLGMEITKKAWFNNEIFEYTKAYAKGENFIYITEYNNI